MLLPDTHLKNKNTCDNDPMGFRCEFQSTHVLIELGFVSYFNLSPVEGGRGKARKLLHGILMDRYYYDLLELSLRQ